MNSLKTEKSFQIVTAPGEERGAVLARAASLSDAAARERLVDKEIELHRAEQALAQYEARLTEEAHAFRLKVGAVRDEHILARQALSADLQAARARAAHEEQRGRQLLESEVSAARARLSAQEADALGLVQREVFEHEAAIVRTKQNIAIEWRERLDEQERHEHQWERG